MTRRGYATVLLVGIALALVVALLSPLASSKPDGLERVAEDEAFIDKGKDAPFEVIADYAFPWVDNDNVATILAGIVGVLAVAAFVLVLGLGLTALSRRAAVGVTKADGPATTASAGGPARQRES